MLALAACSAPPGAVIIEAYDARTGAPIPHAHIRAVPVAMGSVPLPLNDVTLAELLSEGKPDEEGFTDSAGRTLLRLAEGKPHLIGASASPFTTLDAGDGGDEAALTWWELRADHRTLEPADDVAGTPIERRAIRLRLGR